MKANWVWKSFLVFALSISTAHAYFEGFEDLADRDGWRLTEDPHRLLQVEFSGGNPGAYLHGQVAAAVPTWYVPLFQRHTQFLGNYAEHHVASLSFDLNIFAGTQAPYRNVTLNMISTFGTGDINQGVQAYYVGANIWKLPHGWNTYFFPVDATSPTIPPGWVLVRFDGQPATDADWRGLMRSVETLGFQLGKPGFVYPNLNIWDLGLDNVRLSHEKLPND